MPCLKLLPQVEALEAKYGGQMKFAKVEAGRNRGLCAELKVMGMPTLLFFKGGREVDRMSGAIGAAAVEEKVVGLVGPAA